MALMRIGAMMAPLGRCQWCQVGLYAHELVDCRQSACHGVARYNRMVVPYFYDFIRCVHMYGVCERALLRRIRRWWTAAWVVYGGTLQHTAVTTRVSSPQGGPRLERSLRWCHTLRTIMTHGAHAHWRNDGAAVTVSVVSGGFVC